MKNIRTILVLEGQTRAALACVRSLVSAGYSVFVAEPGAETLAGKSKGIAGRLSVPPEVNQPSEYYQWVIGAHRNRGFDLVIPITDRAISALSSGNQANELPLPPFNPEGLKHALEKELLLKVAERIKIPVPRTIQMTLEELLSLQALPAELSFPLIAKPGVAGSEETAFIEKFPTAYFDDFVALRDFATRLAKIAPQSQRILLQKRIVGQGLGVFALSIKGSAVATFAHRRVLEKPPSGGVSVLSESIGLADAPVSDACNLLRELNWDGIAMVEFKRHLDGRYYLMEINPRLWGSLQLAIDCDRDYPVLLAQYSACETEEELANFASRCSQLPEFKVGRRLRWEWGTVDHLISRAKLEGLTALREIFTKNSLNLFGATTYWEVLRLSDWKPFIAETKSWLRNL